MQSSVPTRLLAVQRYVPDALSDAFFTVTVPLTGSAAEKVNTVMLSDLKECLDV